MARNSCVFLLAIFFVGGCDLFESESNNGYLTALSISSGGLSPGFATQVYRYSAAVDGTTSSLTVSATPDDSNASVSINGQSGSSVEVPLEVGSNAIAVVVTAANGTSRVTYSIVVTRLVPTYSVGGSVDGLTGSLTLQNNGADDLAINADGPFTFPTALDDGTAYDVTVSSQPDGQECTVTGGSGTLSGADVSDVSVTCIALSFTVSGQLNGLNDSITLQNNGGDDLELTADGSFTFATELDNGAAYDVTISSQPTDQECTVSNGAGNISGANVTDIVVNCGAPPVYAVGGVIDGLAGVGVLQLNGSDDLIIAKNGLFNFNRGFDDGAAYDVTILTQPPGQTCTVSAGKGTFDGGHALDVRVDCAGTGSLTGSIFDWEWINPLPQGNPITDFASNGVQLVAVGRHGLVQTSPDGLNWTTRDPGTSENLHGVTWGDGKFVAVGLYGVIVTSPDGETWQSQVPGYNFFEKVAWGGNTYVAVGFGISSAEQGGVITTSPDGSTWSTLVLDADSPYSMLDVVWNGTQFAVLQYPNRVHTSPDGVNWTTTEIDTGGNFINTIASDGSRFVATSRDVVYTSLDNGTTWTQEADPLPFTSATSLEWDGSRFVATSGIDLYATSADGASWTSYVVDPSPVTEYLQTSIRHGGLNIIAMQGGAIYTSPDDASWTTNFSRDPESLIDVIWDGSQFVGVGVGARTSPDGSTWTTRLSGNPALGSLNSVTRGSGQYVAVGGTPGSGVRIVTSPDAITWTDQPSPTTDAQWLSIVVWGNNQYVAVGDSGTILTSADGTSWAEQTSGFDGTEYFFDIEWTGSVWVVAGYSFTGGATYFTATSPDGADWTRQELPQYQTIEGLAWNGSALVGVGTWGIGTSIDGLNWTIRNSNVQLTGIKWLGSEFAAVGFGTEILTSTDGLTWSVTRSITGQYSGIASSGDTTVAVSFGSILRKAPPP